MPTAAELIAHINELAADERSAFTTLFLNDQGDGVKAARSKAFASGKAEGKASAEQATAKLTEAQARVTELEGELAELRTKTPDAKTIEDRLAKDWGKKLEAEKQRADTVSAALRTERRKALLADLRTELTRKHDDGTQVDPDWLGDARLLEARFGDRIVEKDDGTFAVRQLGSDEEYQPGEGQTAVALLAADARKTVPAKYIITDMDTGAGVSTRGAFGGAGGYDPVKAGKDMAAQQKGADKTASLAFQ